MSSEGITFEAPERAVGRVNRSRSPLRGEPTAISPNDPPLELANLPEQGPNVYTYHHGPESNSMNTIPRSKHGETTVWDPRGGGAFSLRLTSTGSAPGSMVIGSSEAVPGDTPDSSASGSAPTAVARIGGGSGDGDGGGGTGGGGGDGHGGGGLPWDASACSLQHFAGSTPVTVRFAEVVHWRQRVVYCRPDCTVEHVKWTMRQTVGQHVTTFRIGDGFSGHPLARHWYVTGPTQNNWQNYQEPRRVLVVMPSFM